MRRGSFFVASLVLNRSNMLRNLLVFESGISFEDTRSYKRESPTKTEVRGKGASPKIKRNQSERFDSLVVISGSLIHWRKKMPSTILIFLQAPYEMGA